MLKRYRSSLVALFTFMIAVGLAAAPAHAAKGQWSLGGNFGVGIYGMGQVNDTLKAEGLDDIKDGIEYGGTLRYGIGATKALEVEANWLNGDSKTNIGGTDLKINAKAMALPLNLLFQISENDKYKFHFLIGAGPLLSTKIKTEAGSLSAETASKTAFMAQGGFEGDMFLSPTVALTARALGRYAKASNVDVDANDPSAGTTDIDFSGAAFSLGLRVFFGAAK
jgi:hypothetical protein